MRSDTMRASPPSSSSTTNLPRRPTAVIRRPRSRDAKCFAGSGSVTRCQSDEKPDTVRPTTRPCSWRAIVSTSGSSGRSLHLEARHLVPVRPGAHVDDERDVEFIRAAHLLDEHSGHVVDLVLRDLRDELVVDL